MNNKTSAILQVCLSMIMLTSCANAIDTFRSENEEAINYLNIAIMNPQRNDSLEKEDLEFLMHTFGKTISIEHLEYYEFESDIPIQVTVPTKNVRVEFVKNHYHVSSQVAQAMVNCYDVTNIDAYCPSYAEAYKLYQDFTELQKEGLLYIVTEVLTYQFGVKEISEGTSIENIYEVALSKCISNGIAFNDVSIIDVAKTRILIEHEISSKADFTIYHDEIILRCYKDIYGNEGAIHLKNWDAFMFVYNTWEDIKEEEAELIEEIPEITNTLDESEYESNLDHEIESAIESILFFL